MEYLLASFLIIIIIFSQFFWDNPIKQSTIHKIDALIAKIVTFSFILYTLLYKFKFSYLLLLLAIATSFYLSNHYSTQEWCCNEHIFWHGSLHIFGFISTFYAFSSFDINTSTHFYLIYFLPINGRINGYCASTSSNFASSY